MDSLFVLLQTLYPVSDSLRQALERMLNREVYPKKHWLLQPGQVSNKLYFIEKGVIRGYHLKAGAPQSDGREVTSWFMHEGDFIMSIVSFYTRQPAHEYVELLEDSIIWSITHDQLQHLYDNFLEFNIIGRIITEKYYLLSELRAQNLRMQTAKERYQQLVTDFPAIFQRVPLKYIASHLGLSPETLSRLRGQMT